MFLKLKLYYIYIFINFKLFSMKKNILIILNVFFIICLISCSGNSGGSYTISNKERAYYISKDYIKTALKAPSTAKFPYYSEITVMNYSDQPEIFIVKAWVESQNLFGVPIRNDYTIKLVLTDDTWTCETCIMGGVQLK